MAQQFWNVIANYNQHTWGYQSFLFLSLLISLILAYRWKKYTLPKLVLGCVNLFIGIVFFLRYGTVSIQLFFAAPLYISISVLFFYDAVVHWNVPLERPKKIHSLLAVLVLLYPLVSSLLGHCFPHMVTYIMPCPVISMSIVVYCAYQKRNRLLLVLMTLWGFTGVKAFFFNALEDVILLLCGIYCFIVLIGSIHRKV